MRNFKRFINNKIKFNLILIIYIFFFFSVNNSAYFLNKLQIDSAIKSKPINEQLIILDRIARDNEDYEAALYAANIHFELANNLKEDSIIAYTHQLMGRTLRLVSKYNESLSYLFKAIKIAEKSNRNLIIANSYNGIGINYNYLNEHQKAIEYYYKAIEHYRKVNYNNGIANGFGNSAETFITLGNYNQALENIDSAIYYHSKDTFHTNRKTNMGLSIAYANKANILIQFNKLDEALELINEAIDINRRIDFLNGVSQNLIQIAFIYNLKKEHQKAYKYLLEAEEIIKLIPYPDLRLEFYKEMYKTTKNLNKFQLANSYLEHIIKIKDSLNVHNSAVTTAKLEQKLFEEKMLHENQILVNEKRNNIIFAIVFILFLLIIVIIILNRYKLKDKLNKELVNLNRTKDRFFSIISHDLKTPVASYTNLTEIISDNFDSLTEQEKKQNLDSLKKSSKRILNLLDNLLLWSQIQLKRYNVNPEIINLNELFLEIKNELEENLNQKEINLEFNFNVLEIFSDKNMLSIIFRNLISNSIKFSYPKGKIIIESNSNNNSTLVKIIDYGVGIKSEDKNKIFRLDIKHSTIGTNLERGTGLGLNIVKELVEKINSKIWFESEEGVGTTFYIEFPEYNY